MNERVDMSAILLAEATAKQNSAADPYVSAWVRANAGTGKTHVLVQRIVRLLLTGADPRSLLCLTFTKNAAAEMQDRVLQKLGQWAICTDVALLNQLAILLNRPAKPEEVTLARCLFATIIDTPGGLGILTIHGLCERILRRYSFEAGLADGFTVLTEVEANDALSNAISNALQHIARQYPEILKTISIYATEDQFHKILRNMLGQRLDLIALFQSAHGEDPIISIKHRFDAFFDLDPHETITGIYDKAESLLSPEIINEVIELLAQGSANDIKCCDRFKLIQSASRQDERFDAIRSALLTEKGTIRSSLMTAPIKKRAGALSDLLIDAQHHFLQLNQHLLSLALVDASMALLRLTALIFNCYDQEKQNIGAIDFDDLIQKTLRLLSREGVSEWILYELDARIDHILVDEAQDTSPLQWAIIEKLTADFFAGESARDVVPTIFAVGDEKQSIYGFQGARPELLAANGAYYQANVRQSGHAWRAVDLNLSFRTLSPILTAVDDVCHSLSAFEKSALVPHYSNRQEQGGFVELWEPERGEAQEKTSVWNPEDDMTLVPKAAELLAKRIALKIKTWINTGELLTSKRRPIKPSDILILLRKREPMASLLQNALIAEGVSVAGTDRVALLDTLPVMDILALCDALILTEDDLSLAVVLKSPFFGVTEDELFVLAHDRNQSLWKVIQDKAQTGCTRMQPISARLESWRGMALQQVPIAFLSCILDAEGMRDRFAIRLGPDCHDPLNEILALAETFDETHGGTLSEFMSFMRQTASDIKRQTDQGADEVRIMTIHAAKGLESPIVILADACSTNQGATPSLYFADDERGQPPLPIWTVKGTSQLPQIEEIKLQKRAEESKEAARLLYVAMTRPRDRLYVTGFYNQANIPEASWYQTIASALAPRLIESRDEQNRSLWRDGVHTSASQTKIAAPITAKKERPLELLEAIAIEPPLKILAPSKIGTLCDRSITDDTSNDDNHDLPLQSGSRSIGQLTHRLFEILPQLPFQNRLKAAQTISFAFGKSIDRVEKNRIISQVISYLQHLDFMPIFETGLSEAGLALDMGGGIILMGQLDRLVVDKHRLKLFDYKSGRYHDNLQDRDMHLKQLAAYRQMLKAIYPEMDINSSIFYTQSARLEHYPADVLDMIAKSLKS